MPFTYGHYRPYPGRLGSSVRAFVEAQGFILGRAAEIEAGVADDEVAFAILHARLDLIVLPFHLHRAPDGRVIDGVGVLLQLPENADISRLTLLMPVREFSWGASFLRRYDELKAKRAHFVDRILVAHEGEIGSATLASRMRRKFENRRTTSPPHSEASSLRPLSSRLAAGKSLSDEASLNPSLLPLSAIPSSGWVTLRPPSSGERAIYSSLEIPATPDVPESARERFRRAAELGVKARMNFTRPRRLPKKNGEK